MTRHLFAVVVVVGFALPVCAQVPTGQQTVFAAIDRPAEGATLSLAHGISFDGWSVVGDTKQQPTAIAIYYPDPAYVGNGGSHMRIIDWGVGARYGGLDVALRGDRLDVSLAFGWILGLPISDFTGLSVHPTIPLPLGWNDYTVYFMDPRRGAPAAAAISRWLNIVP